MATASSSSLQSFNFLLIQRRRLRLQSNCMWKELARKSQIAIKRGHQSRLRRSERRRIAPSSSPPASSISTRASTSLPENDPTKSIPFSYSSPSMTPFKTRVTTSSISPSNSAKAASPTHTFVKTNAFQLSSSASSFVPGRKLFSTIGRFHNPPMARFPKPSPAVPTGPEPDPILLPVCPGAFHHGCLNRRLWRWRHRGELQRQRRIRRACLRRAAAASSAAASVATQAAFSAWSGIVVLVLRLFQRRRLLAPAAPSTQQPPSPPGPTRMVPAAAAAHH